MHSSTKWLIAEIAIICVVLTLLGFAAYPLYGSGRLNLQGAMEERSDVASITITPQNPTMYVGQSLTFTAQGYDAQGKPVQIVDPRWSVDDHYGYGSVDPNDPCKFIFTATNPGTGGVACSEGPPLQGPTGSTDINILPQGQLFRIDVTPSSVNLRIGDQQQFNATGYDAGGNQVPITPAWTTTGGTITPSGGLYTATTVGDFNVTASVEGSPVTGTASVHVTQGQLFRIDVTPSSVNLRIGDQQQFNATGYDAGGNQVPITPAWTTTGGTITPSGGLYTATTVGDYTVTATDTGSTVTGTATVHVDTTTGVDNRELSALPTEFGLSQNYPNPFNPLTTIEYHLPGASYVTIRIFSITGELVKTLNDERQSAGYYKKQWNARDENGNTVAGGLYLLYLKADGFSQLTKMVLIR